MDEMISRSLCEHVEALRNKEYSAVELAGAFLKRMEEAEPSIGAYLWSSPEMALESAALADKRLALGNAPLLCGIPMSLKDNISTKDIPTTCASRMLEGYIPPYSATVWEKLSDEGCVLLGKTNMDEFAMGSCNENSAFAVTKNPLDTSRSPGGSSGGSGASVAAGEAVFSIGSDTGGSVRTPAAYCGLVGMKPTYGRVSRYGLVAFASSFDQIGPITRTVKDNATVLCAISGADKRDSQSRNGGSAMPCDIDPKKLRVGICEEFMSDGVSEQVKNAHRKAADALLGMGAQIVQVKLPNINRALGAYYVISSAEASSNLARFDGIRYGYRTKNASADMDDIYKMSRQEGFGREVKRRIMLGTHALSEGFRDEYYKKALLAKALLKEDLEKAFSECDLILSPTVPSAAPVLGSLEDPLRAYMTDVFSVPANIAGIPALALPFGTGEGGLPLSVQLMGRKFSESLLYSVGLLLEGGNK